MNSVPHAIHDRIENLEDAIGQQQEQIDELRAGKSEATLNQLQAAVKDIDPSLSRRSALQAAGIAGVFLASGGTASAAPNADLRTQPSTTADIDHTDRLIHIYQSTGDLLTTVDPDASPNPVQDALDLAANGGTIKYPPGDITYNGTLSGFGGVRQIGLGGTGDTAPTALIDADETTPSYHATSADAEHDAYIEGITFKSQTTPRTAAGFVFDAHIRRWNLGPDVRFHSYTGDDLFHFRTGHPYASRWQSLMASGYNRFLFAQSLGGLIIESPYLASRDNSTAEFDLDDQGGLQITGGWAKGGTSCPLLDALGSVGNSDTIVIGPGNWEPSTDAGPLEFIVAVKYRQSVDIGRMSVTGDFTLNGEHIQVDSAVTIAGGGGGGKRIYGMDNTVGITGNVSDPGALIYFGESANVNNRTGESLNGSVHCLGDGVYKKSVGFGNDGGVTDIVYGPG